MIRRIIDKNLFAHDAEGEVRSFPLRPRDRKRKYRIAVVIDTAIAVPPTTGVTYRLYYLSREMARRGHTVVWILGNRNFRSRDDAKELMGAGIRTHLLSPRLFYDAEYVSRILKKERADVVQYEITQTFIGLGLNVRRITKLPVLLEFHDVEATLRETLGRGSEAPLMKFIQYAAGEYADSMIAMTPTDLRTLVSAIGVQKERIFLAPNGIRPGGGGGRGGGGRRPRGEELLFLGNLYYPPNRDGFAFLAEKVLPKLGGRAVLKSIGMIPRELEKRYGRNPRIRVLGEVKDEERFAREVSGAAVGMCTVFAGSGMKVKILDYCRFGLPVIATAIGASGYERVKSMIVADGVSAIVRSARRLLAHPRRAEAIGAANRKAAIGLYGWPRIAEAVEDALALARRFDLGKSERRNIQPFWLEEGRHDARASGKHFVVGRRNVYEA